MKKLSEFEDEKGIELVAELFPIVEKIAKNPNNSNTENQTPLAVASQWLKNNPTEVKAILALMNEEKPEKYHCNAITIIKDLITVLSDEGFATVFGLQRQTETDSASV